MAALGDLVAPDRRSDRVALRVDDRRDTYRECCTTAWKAAHALRYLGVHEGSRVALAPDPAPPVVHSLFGAALLGARVTFDRGADARVAVVPAGESDDGDASARSTLVYGGDPVAPGSRRWEELVWSENPVFPPGDVDPESPVLGDRSHREVLEAAERVVAEAGIEAETAVALRASLADPRAVVAGVVAPLSADGTAVLSGEGTVAVGDGGPESRRVALDAVRL